MFEYLMPLLVMPTYDNTLLDRTARVSVERQIAYGKLRGVPWGISECGYNSVDASLNYQYRAFGVPGLGLEARPRGGSRHRALRVGAGARRRAGRVVREPAAARRRRARGKIRPVRGHRLHARPAAARSGKRRGALVHGASPGHDPALALARAARASDAAAFRIGPAVQGDAPAAAGAHSEGCRALCAPRRALRGPRALPASGGAGPDLRPSGHADAGSAAPVERPLPRDGHQRGRRKHALERPRGHPLARRRHLRQLGHVLLHPRHRERRILVDRASTDAAAAGALRGDLQRSARGIPPAGQGFRIAPRDRRFAGRRHRAAAPAHHQPLADAAHDRRHELRRSGARVRRRRTRCIRRSPICSCRPRSSRSGRRSCARAGPARGTSRPTGCSI